MQMHITLIRHGKPALSRIGWVTPAGMRQWIDKYNSAEAEIGEIPHECLIAAASAHLVAASTLTRAISSAQALTQKAVMTDAVFAEAELPHPLWGVPPLPPAVWAVLFRLSWLCGCSRGAESRASAQARAKLAAQRLIQAAASGPVILVGHGIMNHFIGKELIASGWTVASPHTRSHWGVGRYSRFA